MSGLNLLLDLPAAGPLRIVKAETGTHLRGRLNPAYRFEQLHYPATLSYKTRRGRSTPPALDLAFQLPDLWWIDKTGQRIDMAALDIGTQLNEAATEISQKLNAVLLLPRSAHQARRLRLAPIDYHGEAPPRPEPQNADQNEAPEAEAPAQSFRQAHSKWLLDCALAAEARRQRPPQLAADMLKARLQGLLGQFDRPANMQLSAHFEAGTNQLDFTLAVPASLAHKEFSFIAEGPLIRLEMDTTMLLSRIAMLREIAVSHLMAVARCLNLALQYYAPRMVGKVQVMTDTGPQAVLGLTILPQAWGLDIPTLAKQPAETLLNPGLETLRCDINNDISLD
ncbi:MAG: hypothetical protein WD046_05785 [Paracoccaceae bacterium]